MTEAIYLEVTEMAETAHKAKRQVSVSGMLKHLGVSRSGYHAWLKRVPSNTEKRREAVKAKIKDIYDESKQNYGAPKITRELRKSGEIISERTVGKYMKQMGIKAQWIKPWTITTKDSDFSSGLKNILDEQFNPERPNAVWCSDITYIWTIDGFVYLTSIMDLYSRKIIAWTLSKTLEVSCVIETIKKAKARRNIDNPLILHSDRESQYVSKEYKRVTATMQCSYSKKVLAAIEAEKLSDSLAESATKKHKARTTDADRFKGIPVTRRYLDLSDEEKVCPICNTPLKKNGEEFVRRELVFIPAKLRVIEFYSINYACSNNSEHALPVIRKGKDGKPHMLYGMASANTVAWVMYQKFCNSMPYFRQEKEWKQYGVSITRATMANWLFCDTPNGAQASAIVYTMVEMAKANGVNVYHYLTYLLEHQPNDKMSDEELEALAPWNESVKAEIAQRADDANQQ